MSLLPELTYKLSSGISWARKWMDPSVKAFAFNHYFYLEEITFKDAWLVIFHQIVTAAGIIMQVLSETQINKWVCSRSLSEVTPRRWGNFRHFKWWINTVGTTNNITHIVRMLSCSPASKLVVVQIT